MNRKTQGGLWCRFTINKWLNSTEVNDVNILRMDLKMK